LGGQAAYGAGARGLRSCHRFSASKLLAEPLPHGGGRMTTEIAVLNRLGIALATDSAVTVGGPANTKVFNSADKLFELTCDYPVAVMINGNTDCAGIPWELIVKDFRESQGKQSRKTIADWATDLLSFAQARVKPISESDEQYVTNTAIAEIEYIKDDILQRLWDSGLSFDAARGLVREVSEQRTEELLRRGISASHADMSIDDLTKQYASVLAKLIAEGLSPIEIDETETNAVMTQIVTSMLSLSPADSLTGLIVAGYGETDMFPSVSSIDLAGMAFRKIKCSSIKDRAIVGSSKGGHVVSFAQNDVIERLLGGADPRLTSKVADFIVEIFGKFGQTLTEIAGKKRASKTERDNRDEAISELTKAAKDEYITAAKEMQDDFKIEFERMIAMMPKIELIEFAEALVNITAIERKATTDQGTVGGPIDVAFVSKHEGFVWIKRKFYFPAALNPRYFWRKFHVGRTED